VHNVSLIKKIRNKLFQLLRVSIYSRYIYEIVLWAVQLKSFYLISHLVHVVRYMDT